MRFARTSGRGGVVSQRPRRRACRRFIRPPSPRPPSRNRVTAPTRGSVRSEIRVRRGLTAAAPVGAAGDTWYVDLVVGGAAGERQCVGPTADFAVVWPVGCRIEIAMPSRITRDQMIEAIRELPPDASVDDAIERLVLLAKIQEGLAQLDRGEGIPHDEVKRRLGL